MARFRHILFVCTNERAPGDPRGSCAARGAKELLGRLKALTHEHGLQGKVRATAAGCLDMCAGGCAVAVFSEEGPAPQTWYVGVTPDDAEALFESHVLAGKRLERLTDK